MKSLPLPPNTQKDFKVAFINLTNEEESSLDTLEHTQKLNRFKDSFTRFFKEMTRNLGSLLFPRGEGVGASAGAASSVGADLVSAHSLFGRPQGAPLQAVHPSPLFSHSNLTPFRPLDPASLKPVDFAQRLERLLPNPSSEKIGTVPFSGTVPIFSTLFGNLSFSPEAFLPMLQTILPSIPTFSLTELPAKLLDSFNALSLEKPTLYTDWKRDHGPLETNPFALDPARTNSLPLFVNPETLGTAPAFSKPTVIRSREETPSLRGSIPGDAEAIPQAAARPVPSVGPRPSDHSQTPPSSEPPSSSPRRSSFVPPSSPSSHIPLIWDALASRNIAKEEEPRKKRLRPISSLKNKVKKTVSPENQKSKEFLASSYPFVSPLALAAPLSSDVSKAHAELANLGSLSRSPSIPKNASSLPHSKRKRLSKK